MPEVIADDGIRLHYVTQGSGPRTVIYLHGMGGDTADWKGMWNALDIPSCRHVALDFRGHGRTESPPLPLTNERLAADVLQVVDALGAERFVVVGHSFGGKVGIRLAALAPHRLAGLVLIGSVGPGRVPLEREAVEPVLVQSGDLAFLRECFRPWIHVWPCVEVDRWLERFARTPESVHRAVCELALWTDLTRDTSGLTVPALIIAGEKDPVYGPEYQRNAVQPSLRHAQMATVACGHTMHMERPAEIAALCARFISALPE